MAKRPTLIPNSDPRWKNKVNAVEDINIIVPKGQMGMPTKQACNECPFAKDSTAGFLGGYSAEMYRPLVYGPVAFACHLTHNKQDITDMTGQRHCTGMAHMRANLEVPYHPDSPLEQAKQVAGKNPDFFDSFEDFKAYHEGKG